MPFRQVGDRIAKYGKGFSNLLTLAGQNEDVVANMKTHDASEFHAERDFIQDDIHGS